MSAPAHAPAGPPALSHTAGRAPRVIVNADDFGYFDCVSRGILEAARDGVVRATSVLATSPRLDEHARWLRDAPNLDVGVHLTVTFGEPLSPELRRRTSPRPRGAFGAMLAVLARGLTADVVRAEWRAQVERCVALGLHPVFLNAHEHVHALPTLHAVVLDVAREFGIRHVRRARAAQRPSRAPRALARELVFAALDLGRGPVEGPRLLGLHESGRLCTDAVRRMFAALEPGGTYDLMCHPGHLDPSEVRDRHLLAYHDWEGELRLFGGDVVRDLAREHGVALVGFRDL